MYSTCANQESRVVVMKDRPSYSKPPERRRSDHSREAHSAKSTDRTRLLMSIWLYTAMVMGFSETEESSFAVPALVRDASISSRQSLSKKVRLKPPSL